MLREHKHLGEAFAGENEEISLTELVKRLVTYPAVAGKALKTLKHPNPDVRELIPSRFQDLSLIAKENEAARSKTSEAIVWFMADGDGIGEHLMNIKMQNPQDDEAEANALSSFSAAMRTWAAGLYKSIPEAIPRQATVVYAGGDDLFGALHESEPGNKDLHTTQLWQWLKAFRKIWEGCGQKGLTVSMGLVWADAQVPQREALQHARDAEASAKARGKNRFALRLLYASGNHLEWTCPWDWLAPILLHYTDREGRSLDPANSRRKDDRNPNWRHLAEDLQWLHSRQAIASTSSQHEAMVRTARALWDAYFPGCVLSPEPPRAITAKPGHSTSVHSEAFRASFEQPEQGRRFDQWLLDLGRVMAGLEKHEPPKGARGRAPQEVAA